MNDTKTKQSARHKLVTFRLNDDELVNFTAIGGATWVRNFLAEAVSMGTMPALIATTPHAPKPPKPPREPRHHFDEPPPKHHLDEPSMPAPRPHVQPTYAPPPQATASHAPAPQATASHAVWGSSQPTPQPPRPNAQLSPSGWGPSVPTPQPIRPNATNPQAVILHSMNYPALALHPANGHRKPPPFCPTADVPEELPGEGYAWPEHDGDAPHATYCNYQYAWARPVRNSTMTLPPRMDYPRAMNQTLSENNTFLYADLRTRLRPLCVQYLSAMGYDDAWFDQYIDTNGTMDVERLYVVRAIYQGRCGAERMDDLLNELRALYMNLYAGELARCALTLNVPVPSYAELVAGGNMWDVVSCPGYDFNRIAAAGSISPVMWVHLLHSYPFMSGEDMVKDMRELEEYGGGPSAMAHDLYKKLRAEGVLLPTDFSR